VTDKIALEETLVDKNAEMGEEQRFRQFIEGLRPSDLSKG